MCNKWILLNENMCKEYDIHYVTCKNCRKYSANAYFIHDTFGDWSCFKCEKEGVLKNFCKYCKYAAK